MSQFVVSARKYRPVTFDSVIGQQAITNTLKNAIRSQQLAQAFLFCGPRGVGKTTCARILARAVNCENPDELDQVEMDEFNVVELDAASNNSVDDIRNLIDQVRIPPSAGKKYKTYVIDEVHMLSTAAFNAFLKTLEEPPPYAIFILATTEKHKILPTILSRCQIFDFQRIKIQDMVEHLAHIAQKEGVEADTDALHIIAQKADGGLRDALSMFDQLCTFTGNKLNYSSVIDSLNVLDYDYYFKVTDAILSEQIPQALLIFSEILSKGFEGQHFLTGLAEHFRNLLVCKDAVTLSLLEVAENTRDRYKQQSEQSDLSLLLRGLDLISQADVNYKMSKNQRLLVELTLMKLCSLQNQDGEKKNDIKIISPSSYRKADIVAFRESPSAKAPQKVEESSPAKPPVKTPETSQTQPPVKIQLAGKPALGISLKDILKPEQKNGEGPSQTDEVQLPSSPVDESALKLLWQEYALNIRQQSKESFYITMTANELTLVNGVEIHYKISNAVQKRDFDKESADLLEFLRQRLDNYHLNLVLEQAKSEEKAHFYGDSAKLEIMAGENPAIKILVQKLGLDVDF